MESAETDERAFVVARLTCFPHFGEQNSLWYLEEFPHGMKLRGVALGFESLIRNDGTSKERLALTGVSVRSELLSTETL